MATIVGNTYNGATVILDGNTYENCIFNNCTLIFSGTAPFGLTNSQFSNPNFKFDGAAQLTLEALNKMYEGGFQAIVEQTFANIRKGQE